MDYFFSKKHKQKKTRYIVFTTNEADGEVKQIKLNNGLYRFLVVLFCVILGAMIGFGIYEGRIYDFFAKQSIENARAIEDLSLEKARLEIENEELGDKVWGEYGFIDAFNLSKNWYAPSFLAIDQGPQIIMIENYRSGLIWKLFMSHPDIRNGLIKLGFTSPYFTNPTP